MLKSRPHCLILFVVGSFLGLCQESSGEEFNFLSAQREIGVNVTDLRDREANPNQVVTTTELVERFNETLFGTSSSLGPRDEVNENAWNIAQNTTLSSSALRADGFSRILFTDGRVNLFNSAWDHLPFETTLQPGHTYRLQSRINANAQLNSNSQSQARDHGTLVGQRLRPLENGESLGDVDIVCLPENLTERMKSRLIIGGVQ